MQVESNSFSAHSDHQKATDFDVPEENNRPCFQTLPLVVKMVSKLGGKWTRMRKLLEINEINGLPLTDDTIASPKDLECPLIDILCC